MAIINKSTKKELNLKENFKTYIKLALNYRYYFLLVLFIVTIIEFTRIFDQYLFKLVVDNGTNFVSNKITLSFFQQILIAIALAFVFSVFLRALGKWAEMKVINRLDGRMIYDLKMKFFKHIVGLSHNFHVTHKTGSLISRMNRGTRAVEAVTDFIVFNLAPLIIQVIIVGISVLYFDALTSMVIILTAVLFVVFGVYMSNRQQYPQYLANRADDIEKGNMADIFTNIDSIKYYGKEKFIHARFEKLADDSKKKHISFWDYQNLFNAGETVIVGLGTFFILLITLIKLMNGELSIGDVTFIYTVYGSMMGNLFGFVHSIRRFYVALGDFDSLFEYDKIQNDIKDKPSASQLKIAKGVIEFKNISFNYSGKNTSAVKDLNLKINENEKVALVGHSGCGKTTLVKLLYRLFDVNKGEILIDGKNIKDFKQESLRSEMSIVPQEAILFDDTIYNNIKFSKPNASRQEVMRAMKFAQLDKFVNDLPLNENTIVGERGVKLSGGEKQRVSIARAILADKKVLVLDEATSALDSETEHEIQKDLQNLMQGRTSIIIAHRLSTIMKADKIVVLEKGKIVQVGKHFDLIKQDGQYKRLWNLQKGGYIKE